ncbi:DUF805 domain-containing protein [Sphingomonas lutea]|uniref:DUF805 domain-containing protein n=1 Tax=Sphingomonas lutea TaxID=1045317 RepID=A0A7G9SG15_9SPHN|nr:DUF805 domain-containing protein [Sphingomonas lutea]QNN66790.1 DUF805 domain-containing protein [Sphingomonas lutea]
MQERSPVEWALLPLKRYAQFSGRAPRAEYWWFSGATFALGLLLDGLDWALGFEQGLFGWIVTLALFIPGIAVMSRRLHDIDRSSWWLVAMLIPVAVIAFEIVQAELSGLGENADLSSMFFVALIAFFIIAVILLIFSLRRGTEGANRYGPDPYGSAEGQSDPLS